MGSFLILWYRVRRLDRPTHVFVLPVVSRTHPTVYRFPSLNGDTIRLNHRYHCLPNQTRTDVGVAEGVCGPVDVICRWGHSLTLYLIQPGDGHSNPVFIDIYEGVLTTSGKERFHVLTVWPNKRSRKPKSRGSRKPPKKRIYRESTLSWDFVTTSTNTEIPGTRRIFWGVW